MGGPWALLGESRKLICLFDESFSKGINVCVQSQSNPKDQVKTSVMKENYAANLETVTLDNIHFDKACVSIYFKGLIEVSLVSFPIHQPAGLGE